MTWTLSDNAMSSTHDEWERIHFKTMMKLLSTPFRLCPWALNAFLGGLKEAFCVHVIHLIIISNYPHYANVTYLALIIFLLFLLLPFMDSPQELQFFCLSPSSLTWWLKQWWVVVCLYTLVMRFPHLKLHNKFLLLSSRPLRMLCLF